MSVSSELSRKRSGTHMDMALLMPTKRLRLSQSLVHASPPGITSSISLTSPQPSCMNECIIFYTLELWFVCLFFVFFLFNFLFPSQLHLINTLAYYINLTVFCTNSRQWYHTFSKGDKKVWSYFQFFYHHAT